MRKTVAVLVAIVLATFSLVGTAGAQDDIVIGTVMADPATVPAAGEYTIAAQGSDFIPDSELLLISCVSPVDTLVPGVSSDEEIAAAATGITALMDCDISSAQNISVDSDGNWSAQLTAEVGDNFFLSAGALDGSQAGATWIPVLPEEDADEGAADEGAPDEGAADEEVTELAETGVETPLIAVLGTAVLGAGVLAVRESRRFRP